jgi:ribonuclease HI
MRDYTDKDRYFILLTKLWSSNERTRAWAVDKLLRYGADAVGPLSRRLGDRSFNVARAALRTLDKLGYGEGAKYYWACRTKPTLTHFSDFGAYLTNVFSDGNAAHLQQAAILAGICGLTYYVPNICYALIRSEHRYAGRALAEALYHLKCPELIPTFRQLVRYPDHLAFELSLWALAEMGDAGGVELALDCAEKSGWAKSRQDLELLDFFKGLRGTAKAIQPWSHEHRWPRQAPNLMCPLDGLSRLALLEWEPADLPGEADYEHRLPPTPQHSHNRVQLWCDASWQKPNQAGWAAVAKFSGDKTAEWSGAFSSQTSTEAEMEAAVRGLKVLLTELNEPADVTVLSDCSVLAEGMNYRAHRWSKTGWFNSQENIVVGARLWLKLLDLADSYGERGHGLSWRWTPGHVGTPLNERVDALAKQAMRGDSTSRSDHA